MKKRELSRIVTSSPFDQAIALALADISPVDATRREYRRDFDLWARFCGEYGIDPKAPREAAVSAFVEWMKKKNHAPKSRARRISALSSLYRELRRRRVVAQNPFSVDDGPRREKVSVVEPTQLAQPDVVKKVIATCDGTPLGVRDAAILRVLWGTGMRRVSLLSMTLERLQKDHAGLIATVTKKGGTSQRVLIRGQAHKALTSWLAIVKEGGFSSGPVWRSRAGAALTERQLNRMIARRAKQVGETLSPHMFRVAFLTLNPSSIEAKQDAAGHADPATTMLYDRSAWRGREAFEQMPEVEELS